MFLELINQSFKGSPWVYLFSIICTSIISVLDALGQFGLKFAILNYLPLYSKGLGWVLPAVVGALAGFIYENLKSKESQQKSTLKFEKTRI